MKHGRRNEGQERGPAGKMEEGIAISFFGPPGFGTWERAAAAAKSLQSCPTLCDPIDGSSLGSPIPGIL